eukprot:CAMPEP_0182844862 /NCGR_PEP_ID=MMETSP0006_2-20121128/27002_1 /TAXON_ID=97485 /ORGANISM="Prymnesium parvum, Strain Texoma1" /LENGTH=242 /DNA_ID=CAMNT_0024974859 /DNA_START=509 /DNA_END=1237 /DNA_ORIENTATION=+
MTEEITYYDDELTEIIRTLEEGVDGLARKRPAAKAEAVREMEERLKRAKQVLHSFKVEMRELPRDQLHVFDQKHKEHTARLQALTGDLQIAKGDVDRHNLGVRSIEEMTAGEILEVASKTQDQSLASVNRMKQRIEESRQVGTETAETLRGQTEQLKNIDVDIMKVKTNLNRADVLIRAFVRKMMTDKIIVVLVCLIFLGVVGIIIYRVVNPDAGNETQSTGPTGWNNQVYSANQNTRLRRA